MNALLRLVRDLITQRIPTTPHMCLRCATYTTTISRTQYRQAARGYINCRCGGLLIPVWTTTGDKTS